MADCVRCKLYVGLLHPLAAGINVRRWCVDENGTGAVLVLANATADAVVSAADANDVGADDLIYLSSNRQTSC